MRHSSTGMVLLLGMVCLAQGPSGANDRKPESGAGDQVTGAGPASESGGVLEFQVVSRQTKEPLAGVDLEIRLGSQTRKEVTNEQGRCRIEYQRQGQQFPTIRASKPGFVPRTVSWGPGGLGAQIPDRYTLALEPGTSLGGIIQDEDGKPIEGATVDLLVSWNGQLTSFSVPGQTLRTDANGRWRCDTVPAKLDDVSIRLAHPGYVSDEMYNMTPKPPMAKLRDMTGVMVMKKGVTLAGRVLDTEGQPIEVATVMQGAMRLGTEYPNTRTGKEGRFEFRNARPGEMILTVQTAGHAPELQKLAVQKGMGPIEFRLERGHALKGRVVDKAGNPVTGAFVAVDGWRGYRCLAWRVNTDADGRFQWSEAPADEVLIDMGKQGYMSIRRSPMTASDNEYTITMYPVLRVAGRVVDRETGQPIPKFTVTSGIDFGDGRSTSWDRRRVKPFTDGHYEISFGEPRYGHLVRVEAEGYLPEVSRPFEDGEGEVTFDMALRKGAGLSGTVCLPDGKPVPGAEVILCTKVQGAYIRDGRNTQKQQSEFVETGPQGRFVFPARTDPYTLVVLHEKGYAQVTSDELGASAQVTLQPWGCVEGKVLLGSRAGANELVHLIFDRPVETGAPRIYHDCSGIADKGGHFVLDRVPPGRGKVCREIRISERTGRFTDSVPIEIKAGETTSVTIGGTGRPVIGKVVIPEEVKDRLDWQNLDYYVRSQSAEGPSQFWAFKLESDGTFRAENIPAGDHCFYLTAYGIPADSRSYRGERIGSLTHPFTVPDIPGGRSDAPLDLGVLELLAVGGSANASSLLGRAVPDLRDLNLGIAPDGSDGKRLLICFLRHGPAAVPQYCPPIGQTCERAERQRHCHRGRAGDQDRGDQVQGMGRAKRDFLPNRPNPRRRQQDPLGLGRAVAALADPDRQGPCRPGGGVQCRRNRSGYREDQVSGDSYGLAKRVTGVDSASGCRFGAEQGGGRPGRPLHRQSGGYGRTSC